MRIGRYTSSIMLIALLGCVASTAHAHEISVSTPGPVELDFGTAQPARLLHATLVAPRDAIRARVRPAATPLEVLLLIPDQKPERTARDGRLPRLKIRRDGQGVLVEPVDRMRVVDEATGIRYRVIGRADIAPAPASVDDAIELVVTRGASPTRVALRVGDAETFAALDPERTPRAVARAAAWSQTPVAGSVSGPRRAPGTRADLSRAIWGAAIAGAAILVGIWWVRTGRRRSRERGAERARGEQ